MFLTPIICCVIVFWSSLPTALNHLSFASPTPTDEIQKKKNVLFVAFRPTAFYKTYFYFYFKNF